MLSELSKVFSVLMITVSLSQTVASSQLYKRYLENIFESLKYSLFGDSSTCQSIPVTGGSEAACGRVCNNDSNCLLYNVNNNNHTCIMCGNDNIVLNQNAQYYGPLSTSSFVGPMYLKCTGSDITGNTYINNRMHSYSTYDSTKFKWFYRDSTFVVVVGYTIELKFKTSSPMGLCSTQINTV